MTYKQLKIEWKFLNSSVILVNLLITCVLLTFDLTRYSNRKYTIYRKWKFGISVNYNKYRVV